jgi:Methyltransferase domain
MNTSDQEAEWAERLRRLDTSLWAAIPSSASTEDRRSLLALQAASRHEGYAYLEIGSEAGGSLQSHLRDPWCGAVLSIDLRVEVARDVRGTRQWYKDNTTAAMVAGLERAYPGSCAKLRTFDMAARDVPADRIAPAPVLLFIDAEHTRAAVREDFAFARRVAAPEAWIAFHDADLIHEGIRDCLADLGRDQAPHAAARLEGDVFVIALGADAARRLGGLAVERIAPEEFFRNARGRRARRVLAERFARFNGWRHRCLARGGAG